MGDVVIHRGHVLEQLRQLPARSVHCVVTSPPYWGLRDYGLSPQVWGGDPHCRHHWQRERLLVERGKGGHWQQANNGQGMRIGKSWTRYRGNLTAARTSNRVAMVTRSTCRRCGAWRGSLGLEPTPELYVEHLVLAFREIRRALRDDGTVWLNLGDTYFGDSPPRRGSSDRFTRRWDPQLTASRGGLRRSAARGNGLKPKDLVMIPARVALALQADGWWLRSDVVWHKPNPIPEAVLDRPTRAHEYLFLLSKRPRYFYDVDAIREPHLPDSHNPDGRPGRQVYNGGAKARAYETAGGARHRVAAWRGWAVGGRNRRTVWTVPTQPYKGAHFATFPERLIEPCVLAGTSEAGCCASCGAPYRRVVRITVNGKCVPAQWRRALARRRSMMGWRPTCRCARGGRVPAVVMDPFMGSGTTAVVAVRHGRRFVGVELNPAYVRLARGRIRYARQKLGDRTARDVLGRRSDRRARRPLVVQFVPAARADIRAYRPGTAGGRARHAGAGPYPAQRSQARAA